MAVYVDDCFVEGDWGKWQGGGHMQADSLDELHAMAKLIGLKEEWFQCKSGRPDRDHYDLMARRRELALKLGAVSETMKQGAARRAAIRREQDSVQG